jgi:hypothetical protein
MVDLGNRTDSNVSPPQTFRQRKYGFEGVSAQDRKPKYDQPPSNDFLINIHHAALFQRLLQNTYQNFFQNVPRRIVLNNPQNNLQLPTAFVNKLQAILGRPLRGYGDLLNGAAAKLQIMQDNDLI